MPRQRFEDEEEVYIPEIEVDESGFNVHDRIPHSNAGIALGWSALEQQMFDMLLLNRFAADDQELLDKFSLSPRAKKLSRILRQ